MPSLAEIPMELFKTSFALSCVNIKSYINKCKQVFYIESYYKINGLLPARSSQVVAQSDNPLVVVSGHKC